MSKVNRHDQSNRKLYAVGCSMHVVRKSISFEKCHMIGSCAE